MALTPPNISKFHSILGAGIQRPWRYYVLFQVPAKIGEGGAAGKYRDAVGAFAYRVELPGKQIETQEWRHLGTIRHMPTYTQYNSIQMTFLCDQNMMIKKMLDAWQSYICEPVSNYVNYYDDYGRQSCVILSLDDRGLPTYGVRLNEFWPRRVDPIQFSAVASNEPAMLETEFVYRNWYNQDTLKSLDSNVDSQLKVERSSYIESITNDPFSTENQRELTRQLTDQAIQSLDSGLRRLAPFLQTTIQSAVTNLFNV